MTHITRFTELTRLLKRPQLGPMTYTPPYRIAQARRNQLDSASLLDIIVSDEVNRRARHPIELRLGRTGSEENCRPESFDWSASITLHRRLLGAAISSEFLDKCEHVLLIAPPASARAFWLRPRATQLTALAHCTVPVGEFGKPSRHARRVFSHLGSANLAGAQVPSQGIELLQQLWTNGHHHPTGAVVSGIGFLGNRRDTGPVVVGTGIRWGGQRNWSWCPRSAPSLAMAEFIINSAIRPACLARIHAHGSGRDRSWTRKMAEFRLKSAVRNV